MLAWFMEDGEPLLQRGDDGAGGTGHQPLHENHQEPDVGLFLAYGLVIAFADILGYCVVELLLILMTCPIYANQFRDAWFEQWIPVGVDSLA